MTALSPLTLDNKGKPTAGRPIAIFSDFDGTIFMQDTGHILFDHHGCGPEKREYLDESISTGEKTFRGASEEMWGSLHVTLDEGFKTLKSHLVMDDGFKDFFNYTTQHKIPFNVISAGLKPLLRHVLDETMGEEQSARIGIVSNDAKITEDGSVWTPIWRHDSELGHDKAQSIQDYKDSCVGEIPLIVFIGDGVSDLAAAGQADVLFARQGLKLEQYCIKNKIPYIPYNSFSDIKRSLHVLVDGNENHLKSDDSITVSVAPSGSSSIPPGSNYGSGSSSDEESVSSLHSIEKRPPLRSMLSGVAYAV
ncbi:hypothetical protein DV451_002479 [Geotrichum candidum]|uniref:Uncharacterized protein n=1 Tax=Geotrichum candidum TaxID=1173061 RepID=A0A9P5G4S3_GEOCN|nr:hypothetical protein DV451_002479 [Geotrichum candidum]KAF5107776.1 hypothetical protein DV453_002803 [Geotrichum candidum]